MSTFSSLQIPAKLFPWQSTQWQQLSERISLNRLPHALLLLGPKGVGKLNFSAVLVERVLCRQPRDGLACGQCKSCLLYLSGNHPDIKVIECLPKKKNISIDQIREVSDFMNKQAQLSGYRCIVIANAEQMSESASNALLKVLEEPGEQSLFVLVSHSAGSLKPTIKSRCQMIRFVMPSSMQALLWLTPLVNSSEQAQVLLSLSGGAPVVAKEAQQWTWLDQREVIAKQLLALRLRQTEELVVASTWQNVPPLELLLWLYSWMLDCMKLSQGLVIVNQDLAPILGRIVDTIERDSLFYFSDAVLESYLLLAHEGNPNILLMLEGLTIRWSQLP